MLQTIKESEDDELLKCKNGKKDSEKGKGRGGGGDREKDTEPYDREKSQSAYFKKVNAKPTYTFNTYIVFVASLDLSIPINQAIIFLASSSLCYYSFLNFNLEAPPAAQATSLQKQGDQRSGTHGQLCYSGAAPSQMTRPRVYSVQSM